MKIYNHNILETEIQKFWDSTNCFDINLHNFKKKYYCLSMFPYPSGKLHIGHIRNYTIGDIIARSKKMMGFNTFNPIGWDAFGMPAENAARDNNISPKIWTEKNIDIMKIQLKNLGFSFDWTKEINTTLPEYYKWEQMFFIKLYESGLVYKKKGYINWDPVDNTVLANEQVIDGLGWRSNAKVERKYISQWYIKIADYAEELLNDISLLENWPKKVKDMQKNWIKKHIGYYISFYSENNTKLCIFIKNLNEINNIKFISVKNYTDEYSILKNSKFIYDPIIKKSIFNIKFNNDDLNNNIKFYKLNSTQFFLYKNIKNKIKKFLSNHFLNNLITYDYNNIYFSILSKKNLIKKGYSYNLKDWCISRQRFWGVPIPIIYCNNCGKITERIENLPIKLPEFQILNYKDISLINFDNFIKCNCPICGNESKRETDTFDTFFESSWYYLKYLCDKTNLDSNILNEWLPVDHYIGGIEHATLHLIYARFFHKIMKDFEIVVVNEPFNNLLTQGMVLMNGSKMSKSKGNIIDQNRLIKKYGADTLRLFTIFSAPPEQSFEWQENGIIGCKKFLEKIWNFSLLLESKLSNFKNIRDLDRIFIEENINLINNYNSILDEIYFNFNEKYLFNVVVALSMKLYNIISHIDINSEKNILIIKIFYEALLKILFPIVPHIIEYIWINILNNKYSIMNENFSEKIFIDNMDKKKIMIYINNKFKKFTEFDSIEDIKNYNYTINKILSDEDIKLIIKDRKIKNIIYKNMKLVNLILE
jgi:leucyl-tRNA synthetase